MPMQRKQKIEKLMMGKMQASRQDLAAGGPTFSKYRIGCVQQPVGQT